VTVEFDYKQLETERKQNESQRDVVTVCYTQFGRVSGKYIFLKHNFRTQQKETQNVAHQLATCSETRNVAHQLATCSETQNVAHQLATCSETQNVAHQLATCSETQTVAHQLATCSETLTEFRKTYSFHSLYCDRAISSSKESSPQSVI